MVYLDVTVAPGGRFQWELPRDRQGFVYVFKGSAHFPADDARAAAGQVAVLGEGGGLELRNDGQEALSFVLAAGEPIREPVIWNGPFVD
jgi:redox-sensitive bicupin YhaK (pirin superfamily)